jgi:hypothetical protein
MPEYSNHLKTLAEELIRFNNTKIPDDLVLSIKNVSESLPYEAFLKKMSQVPSYIS